MLNFMRVAKGQVTNSARKSDAWAGQALRNQKISNYFVQNNEESETEFIVPPPNIEGFGTCVVHHAA